MSEISSISSIPFQDELVLGPIEKYERYAIFPWKFIIHIVMLLLTTFEIIIVLGPDLKFSEAVMQQIYQQFMIADETQPYSPPTNAPHVEIYD